MKSITLFLLLTLLTSSCSTLKGGLEMIKEYRTSVIKDKPVEDLFPDAPAGSDWSDPLLDQTMQPAQLAGSTE